jgi:hypothetical protein
VRGLKFRSISSLKPLSRGPSPSVALQYVIRKLIPFIGLGKYAGSFAGVSCFTSTIGELKNRAAVALPGIGIFIHPNDVKNISLLRHEYGHILQAKKWGTLFFYRSIAKESFFSARRSNQDSSFIHQHTWTEWTANRLSYYFFKRPDDWDMKLFPIHPPLVEREGTDWPEFLRFNKPTPMIKHNAT